MCVRGEVGFSDGCRIAGAMMKEKLKNYSAVWMGIVVDVGVVDVMSEIVVFVLFCFVWECVLTMGRRRGG